MTRHDQKEAAAAHLDRAERALRSARILLNEGEALDAISRAYYAALHAARAALACVGEAPKSHRGTHTLFWTHFVKKGHLPRSLGRILSDAEDMRTNADYDAFTRFDTAAAADLISDVETFVATVEAFIQEQFGGASNAPAETS